MGSSYYPARKNFTHEFTYVFNSSVVVLALQYYRQNDHMMHIQYVCVDFSMTAHVKLQ